MAIIENEEDWLHKIRSELEPETRQVDPEIRNRLSRIREQAVNGNRSRPGYAFIFPAAVMTTACLVIAVVMFRPVPGTGSDEMINDLDVITTTDNLDLMEDLEFFEWLDDYEFPS